LGASLLVAAAFFMSEHNLRLSTALHFTESAEEMLATVEGGNTLRRLAFLAIAGLGIYSLIASSSTRLSLTPLSALIALMATLCFASVVWAQDTGLCLRRLMVLGLALLGSVGLARRLTMREICQLALIAALGCTLIGLAAELVLGTFRPWESEYRFSGSVHPNTQGMYLATSMFAALCLWSADPPRWKWYLCVLGVCLLLLVLTKSRTSTAGVLATLAVMSLLLAPKPLRWAIPVICVWLAAGGLMLLAMSGSHADALLAKIALMGREDEAESFSGRTTIWPVVQAYIDQRFWLGYGFESFWTPEKIEAVTEVCEWPVREAHSAYRDMLLSLGVVGLALYLLIALGAVVASLAAYLRTRDGCLLFCLAMVLNGSFNAMFESGMVMISLPTFVLATAVVRVACYQAQAVPGGLPRRTRMTSFSPQLGPAL
jgi:O-antigen ligase